MGARRGAHGAADFEAPLGAVRQVAGRIVGAADQVRLFQPEPGLLDGILRFLRIAADAEQAHDCKARSLHQLVVLGDEQILENRQAREEPDVLEGAGHLGVAGDLEVGHPLQQELLAGLLTHRDHAHGRLVEAGHAVEDRGLASAVGADERRDLAALGLEGEVVDGHEATETHREVLDFQDGIARHRICRHCRVLEGHQPCPSLVKLPETALRSLRKAVGSRLPTKPRGFQTMTTTMARPKISMR